MHDLCLRKPADVHTRIHTCVYVYTHIHIYNICLYICIQVCTQMHTCMNNSLSSPEWRPRSGPARLLGRGGSGGDESAALDAIRAPLAWLKISYLGCSVACFFWFLFFGLPTYYHEAQEVYAFSPESRNSLVTSPNSRDSGLPGRVAIGLLSLLRAVEQKDFEVFLSQRRTQHSYWLHHLLFLEKLENLIPWWLENRGVSCPLICSGSVVPFDHLARSTRPDPGLADLHGPTSSTHVSKTPQVCVGSIHSSLKRRSQQ